MLKLYADNMVCDNSFFVYPRYNPGDRLPSWRAMSDRAASCRVFWPWVAGKNCLSSGWKPGGPVGGWAGESLPRQPKLLSARWHKCCSQGESQTEQWRHNLYQVRSSLTYVSIDSNLCNIWQGVRSGLHLLAMRDKSINIWQGVRSGFILAAMRFRKSFISAFFG